MQLFDGRKHVTLRNPDGWQILSSGDGHAGDLSTVQAWQTVPYLYRAVDLRARAVAGLPFSLTRRRDGADAQRHSQWRGLLRGLRLRLYQTEGALCLYGAAYWLKESNVMGRNVSPRWVLPTSVAPHYDASYGLLGFERHTADGTQPLTPDEVVYFWQPGLTAELGPGVPPAHAALSAAGVLHHLAQFTAGFFERGAIKATLLSVEGTPPAAELERLEHWWRRMVSGVRRAWETVAIRSTVKPVVVGDGLADTVNATLTQQQREDICAALGVPHSLISADAANYATSQQDTLNFYQQTVVPQAQFIEEVINEQLMDGLGLRWQLHPERLEVFQAAEMQKAHALAQLVGQPLMTVAEGRAWLGLPALPADATLPLTPPAAARNGNGNGHAAPFTYP